MPIKNINFKNKKCKICSKEFKPHSSRTIYCSDECRRGIYNCIICNKKFLGKSNTSGKYCSLDCFYISPYKGKFKEKECPVCKEIFQGGSLSTNRR